MPRVIVVGTWLQAQKVLLERRIGLLDRDAFVHLRTGRDVQGLRLRADDEVVYTHDSVELRDIAEIRWKLDGLARVAREEAADGLEWYRAEAERTDREWREADERLRAAQQELHEAERAKMNAFGPREKARFNLQMAREGNIHLPSGSWLSRVWAEENPEGFAKIMEREREREGRSA